MPRGKAEVTPGPATRTRSTDWADASDGISSADRTASAAKDPLVIAIKVAVSAGEFERVGRLSGGLHSRIAVRLRPYLSNVKVLGIDPGTAACGYGIVQERDGRLRAVAHGVWRTAAHTRLELRLRTTFDGVDARTALSVGQARGAVLVACARAGVEAAEYAPNRVKQMICGYGHAEKAQVQGMVKAILGLADVPRPHHAADALAVAICHALAPPLLKAAG